MNSKDTAKPVQRKPSSRHKARALAAQALYAWHLSGLPLYEIEAQFRVDNDFKSIDEKYFSEIMQGVSHYRVEIDQAFEHLLDRPLLEIDPVELAVLRLSTFELCYRADTPYRVIINEGIELAKTFGATDGHKFVNGVLDKLVPIYRKAEQEAYQLSRR